MSGVLSNRQLVGGWLERLLDPGCQADEQQAVTTAWLEEWLALLSVDIEGEFAEDLPLPGGLAVSPLTAARCLSDAFRTTQFLRALDHAIADALVRFPDEIIEVLEAGCGPLAPLSLPFAVRYADRRVRFTLLDARAVSLEAAMRLAAHLGVSETVEPLQGDATAVTLTRPPHIIACEMIQRGLTREPQAAATLNLAPQMQPGGAFIPAEVRVRAGLFNAGARYGAGQAGLQDLGPVAVLRASGLDAPTDIEIPPFAGSDSVLSLLTTIRLDDRRVIDDFESVITLPEKIAAPGKLAETGGRARVSFDLGASPGPRLS